MVVRGVMADELDGVSVTMCLSYIYLANGPCYTNLAYLKETYGMTSSFWNLLCSFMTMIYNRYI